MNLTLTFDSIISSWRITTFLQMSERDPGVLVRTADFSVNQMQQLEQVVPSINEKAILVTGTPSFSWSLAEDKVVPAVLDTFYKKNAATMKQIAKKLPKLLQ